MSSSNHTRAFAQCCHGKHTVAGSRNLLSDHIAQHDDILLPLQIQHSVGYSLPAFSCFN